LTSETTSEITEAEYGSEDAGPTENWPTTLANPLRTRRA